MLNQLLDRFDQGDGMTRKKMREILDEICADFKTIPVAGEPKIRVGVVGEIYIKFSALGNNQLEEFLQNQDCEYIAPRRAGVPAVLPVQPAVDWELYGAAASPGRSACSWAG